MKRFFCVLFPGILVFALDRILKTGDIGTTYTLLEGVLGIRYLNNTGVAFGLFSENAWVVAAIAALIIVGLLIFLRKIQLGGLSAIGISMILGGAIGNLFDRVFHGAVIDMIELLFIDFYVFNLADVGVVCGAALCILSVLFRPQEWSKR